MGVAPIRPGEMVDLPVDMQNELQKLESGGDRLTHYELLDIDADADGGTIRRAYLERSKRFHPDAWYRKELGPYAALLSKWFQRLSAAYQVLSDEDLRAAYDRDHRAHLSARHPAALERRELSRADEERRSHERRDRLLRTKGFARLGAARRLYEEALEHALNGERTQAIFALKAARELDPNRKEIGAKLVELEREQAKARARSALASAKEREERKKFADAITGYAAAFQNDPTSFEAAMGATRCALATSDPRTATNWATRAVQLSPGDPEARLLLARLLLGAGMKARARTELTALLDKNPDHKEAKALLKAL